MSQPTMVRVHVCLTPAQRQRLMALKRETGVPIAEQLRRAAAAWIAQAEAKLKE